VIAVNPRDALIYHFVSTGIDDHQDQSATFEIAYEIHLTNNILYRTAKGDPELEMFFSLLAIKQ
jgi:hypothetical protein